MLEMFVIQHTSTAHSLSYSTPLSSNAYGDVTDFEICHFHKTQKSRYFENETLFFHQIKKFINYTSSATLLKKKVL